MKFQASGPGASQIVAAQVQLQSAQNQLELTRTRANRAHQEKLKAQKELRDVTLELIRLKIGINSLQETVKIVSKGIKAIAEMSKHWKQFLSFFDEMSARVKIVLGKLLLENANSPSMSLYSSFIQLISKLNLTNCILKKIKVKWDLHICLLLSSR